MLICNFVEIYFKFKISTLVKKQFKNFQKLTKNAFLDCKITLSLRGIRKYINDNR